MFDGLMSDQQGPHQSKVFLPISKFCIASRGIFKIQLLEVMDSMTD